MTSMWFSPPQLHLPDGFLQTPIALIGWALAVGFVMLAIRQTREQLGERQIPWMGVLAAFIFAAQAINFPVVAGTSGHLLGGALAAIVMGPWAATMIMTAVIVIQALLFQDGGLLVMGWNIVNMGVLTAFTGHAAYALLRRGIGDTARARLAAGFSAGWISVEVGALATAFELALSGTSPLELALPAMASVHALIGVGEGLITMGAIAILQAARPQALLSAESAPGGKGASLALFGLLSALMVAILSPWASSAPDGLESVAASQGFLEKARGPVYDLLPDYTLPFIPDPVVTTMLAVMFGTLLVFVIALILGRSTAQRTQP